MKKKLSKNKNIANSAWVVAVFCFMFSLGVLCSRFIRFDSLILFLWLGILIIPMLFFVKRRVFIFGLALISGLCLGIFRGGVEMNLIQKYDKYFEKEVAVYGVISEDLDTSSKGQKVVRLKNVVIDNEKLPGMVYIQLSTKDSDLKRSDSVIISGKLKSGFGSFNASMYQAEVLEFKRDENRDPALTARNWFSDNFKKVVSEPAASLGLGYLVGQRRDLPPDLSESLRIAGLTHIIVASGYNLTILVRFSRRIFSSRSKYLALFFSLTLIVGFIFITGFSPSMSRAGFVAGLSLFIWYYGRKIHPMVLMLLVSGITVAINPAYIWGDIGWMLSFSAFAGVMFLAPTLNRFFYGEKEPGVVRQILFETVSAQIFTMPIIIYYFGVVSNVAIFANLLILPFIPLTMLLVFISGIFAWIYLPIGKFFGWITENILNSMLKIADYFANLNWSQTEIKLNIASVVASYFVIILLTYLMYRADKFDYRDVNLVD